MKADRIVMTVSSGSRFKVTKDKKGQLVTLGVFLNGYSGTVTFPFSVLEGVKKSVLEELNSYIERGSE